MLLEMLVSRYLLALHAKPGIYMRPSQSYTSIGLGLQA